VRGAAADALEHRASLVAAYIERLSGVREAPTVKQHLAAIKMMLNWMVTGQVIRSNPAASVRGPKHVVRRGKTPYLSAEDAKTLLKSIDATSLVGLRDRALIGVMTYSFARISAVLGMTVDDYNANGKKWRSPTAREEREVPRNPGTPQGGRVPRRLHPGGGNRGRQEGAALSVVERKDGKLSERPLGRKNAWEMVKRRAMGAGLTHMLCNHSFGATGITAYIAGGGTVEKAQKMAGHSSTKTTELYNRTEDEITLDEVERIAI